MWCIGELTAEYRRRMYDLLALYAKPLNRREPVVCVDEKSLQIVSHSRASLPIKPEQPAKDDFEYVRNGTANVFVAVEARAGRRTTAVTQKRGKVDFVGFIARMLRRTYAHSRCVHLVMDNLNIHSRQSFVDVMGKRAADTLLRRVKFHYTPKHASWLNMAEIEIGALTRQCLARRFQDRKTVHNEVQAWQSARNAVRRTIQWNFTRQDADRKLGRHYVPLLSC